MSHRIRSFPQKVNVRIEPDHDDDILVAGPTVRDCLGHADTATIGEYHLVRVIEVNREIHERPVRLFNGEKKPRRRRARAGLK